MGQIGRIHVVDNGSEPDSIQSRRPIPAFEVCKPLLEDAAGLEIGGPSSIFRRRRLFPVYSIAAHIDNCNFSDNRCMHHHVFDTSLAARAIDFVGLRLLAVEAVKPNHIFVAAQKIRQGLSPNNGLFLDRNALHFSGSPFLSDRL
jgi:hypothetical protein